MANNLKRLDSYLVPGKHIHLIGIGGVSMRPLGLVLRGMGITVTGSDMNASVSTDELIAKGIEVHIGHRAENIQGADCIIRTAAAHNDNPEVAAARAQGIPVFERAQAWGVIMREYKNAICVSGTHGKTTTTGMLTHIFMQAQRDPTVMMGGYLPLLHAGHRVGSGDTIIMESCEYCDSFLNFYPTVAIVNNIEADHLDYFGTLENVIQSFHKFASKASKAVIANADDTNTQQAIAGLAQEVITFGTDSRCQWFARNIEMRDAYAVYDLYHNGVFFAHVSLSVPGEHNVLNSMAAAAAAHLCGASAEQIVQGISDFHGAGRRFEFLGTARDVTVADDYAHHPTEIRATLEAAKGMGYSRVWAVFQPFTYSRTARHLEGFITSLSNADEVIVSDIMGSREENTYGVSSKQITERIPGAQYLPTFEQISAYLLEHVQPGDLVLTMGGGDIYKCARMILNALKQ